MVVVEVEVQVVVFVIVAHEAREVRRVRAKSDARIVMRVLRCRAQDDLDVLLSLRW